MKLKAISIEGFRGYSEKTVVDFDDLTVLAGKNDAGKSTVFEALNLFLGQAKPDALDHSVHGEGAITIACTFTDLPPTLIIDESAHTLLGEEHLLDKDGNLTVKKVWQRGRANPEVKAIAFHPTGDGLPLLHTLKQTQLKALTKDLDLDARIDDRRVNFNYRRAIWQEWEHRGLTHQEDVEIPLNLEDGKQIALALESAFPVFHLFRADREGSEAENIAQDPAKLIVKSVLDRYSEDLATLASNVQKEISEMLSDVVDRLSEIAPALASGLSPIDIEPSWHKAFSTFQFLDANQVPLAKRGSGTRRLVLLSFFRAEAERGYDDDVESWRRGIITAIEEPETALHPDLQRETLAALSEVSALPSRQVMLTTHSSNLVREIPINAIRFVEEIEGKRSWLSQSSADDRKLLEHLTATMGTFTDHDVRCFVFVEGKNDIEGILGLSDGLYARDADNFPDLRVMEQRGELCFIPIGGCGAAALWESRLSQFGRKEVHILDSDRTSPASPLKEEIKTYAAKYAETDHEGKRVFILERRELENYLTQNSITDHFYDVDGFDTKFAALMASEEWNYADIPVAVAHALHTCRSSKDWSELSDEYRSKKESRAKHELAKCFQHSSVAESLVRSSAGHDIIDVLQAIDL